MRLDEIDYHLPRELVAQVPAARREDARLMLLPRSDGATRHRSIRDLPRLLDPGDLLVLNDTRVLAARLFGRRATGGKVEFLLLEEQADGGVWTALVKAGGTLQEGESIDVLDGGGAAVGVLRLVNRVGGGHWTVRAGDGGDDGLPDLMERAGKLPLPPYIHRERADPRDVLDRERYQTVFAREPGAVAAPTAGLHLTDALLAETRARGVGVARVTLHVGLGTFLPVQSEQVEEHPMHAERYHVPEEAAAAVRSTRERGGRVIAVGTTSVRALEAAAACSPDGLPAAGGGSTELFILPGYEFRAVDGLLTNFHLPKSTLLCLVGALAGRERVLAAYSEAVEERYRFYSYGDAMLIV